ncbi:hypothetical protein [Pontibacter cellulosilyticus]|uniref:Uncharacterized protein n=1 Tax=Pontibacter cellulosilyticus TaxID=1720253 RepID=A0A923N852_9BACT|nr:hypothetical protein [Pontibacter cellulosilyticus]MBC5992627.1 hypothetical protein [Pontibacter cellulosilyticus]
MPLISIIAVPNTNMHQPTAIATTLTLPNSLGQLLLSAAYSYCLSVYSYWSYYYRYYRNC